MGKLGKPFGKGAEILFALMLPGGAQGTDGGAVIVPVPVENFVFPLRSGSMRDSWRTILNAFSLASDPLLEK
jgi:hypothetical protein